METQISDIITDAGNVEVRVEDLETTTEDQEKSIIDLTKRIEDLEKNLAEYLEYKKKKESDVPYFEILSESFDETTGIEMKFDWNEAMINFLKRNGYRGADDDEIIMKYVYDTFNSRANNDPIT